MGSGGELAAENLKLKQTLDELKRRIADKNHYLNKAEYEKKDLETVNVELTRKVAQIEKELKRAKEQA